jgi:galactokinase
LDTVAALKVGEFNTVGINMTASHKSLSNDFEVSCKELDLLVDLALEVKGVLGSRMTGGGFGGCTVTLVEKGALPALKEHLEKWYRSSTGLDCVMYEASPSAGAGLLV